MTDTRTSPEDSVAKIKAQYIQASVDSYFQTLENENLDWRKGINKAVYREETENMTDSEIAQFDEALNKRIIQMRMQEDTSEMRRIEA